MNRPGRNNKKRARTQIGSSKRRRLLGRLANIPKMGTRMMSRIIGQKKTMDIIFVGATNPNPRVSDLSPSQCLTLNSTNRSIQSLNLIQQGAAESQRLGNKVKLASIRLQFNLDLCTSGAAIAQGGSASCRLMVIYDSQPNGAYPANDDFLNALDQNNALVPPTGVQLVNYQLNPNNFERFKVLYDQKITTPPSATIYDTTITSDPTSVPWFVDKYIKLNGLETTFKGTTAPQAIANTNTGNLFIVTYGEYGWVAAGGSGAAWQYQGTARLRFHDA